MPSSRLTFCLCVLATAALASTGCKLGASGCASGEYKAPDGSFCMALPSSFETNAVGDTMDVANGTAQHVEFSGKSEKGGTIMWSKTPFDKIVDEYKSGEGSLRTGGYAVDDGTIAGDRGFWTRSSKQGATETIFVYKVPSGMAQCRVMEYASDHLKNGMDACKSVHAPGTPAPASFDLPAVPAPTPAVAAATGPSATAPSTVAPTSTSTPPAATQASKKGVPLPLRPTIAPPGVKKRT